MKTLKIYTDGAARGNPGPSAAGWLIREADGTILQEGKQYLGELTNNQAEYRALLLALVSAASLAKDWIVALEIHMDSELVVRQLLGEYKVKNEGLKPLFQQAKLALGKFSQYTIQYIPREQNAEADQLANEAIDER